MEAMIPTFNELILDENIPFSQSRIWDYQRDYYAKQGIHAWANKIPFYITSNPYIANSYAHIIIRFIQDCIKKNSLDPAAPFYIVEIGAGSGTFSFYLLKRLAGLKEALSVNVQLVYVMTDLIRENIDFSMAHENFQPFIAAGMLDFAHFDAEYSKEIALLRSKTILRKEDNKKGKNPFVFIANYCFDSLKHDVFQVSGGSLLEGLCKLTTDAANMDKDQVVQLNQVKVSFQFQETQLPYYHHEVLNQLLQHYKATADQQYISFPIGPLMCIKHLLDIADNRLLLISSDKGFSKHLDIYQKEAPAPVFHDNNCFSLSVNFDAISQYFKLTGGDSFNQFTEQALTTSAFISGFTFADMQETALALETSLNSFGHSTINNLFLNASFTANLLNIEAILPFLGAIRWDPRVFNSCRDVIINQIRNGYARTSDIEDLKEKMPVIEEHFYMLPKTPDTFFDIGVFFQEIQHYERALEYYEKSIRHFGEKDITLYNMGLCHYHLNQPAAAVESFSAALQQNPTYIMARGWIAQIAAESAQ
ncbi:SAM-dependent methyltransferase [uncultured Chitinophaga sp.]|jgi:Tfp pilus assembly protein PilF|uniref:tetratricopeptide repeat protein n=1 Tax=uncultured Chitinophaga sp. TaxID=339340 RepID=UPI00262F366B|nr:SAM-dependent methyltransferase [uncultured Chitinophaga sp.]